MGRGGRRLRMVVEEYGEYGLFPIIDTDAPYFPEESKKVKGRNPCKAYRVLVNQLDEKNIVDNDVLFFYPATRGFSLKNLGQGLRRMGELLNQPLFYIKKEEEEEHK